MSGRFYKLPIDVAALRSIRPADKVIYAVLADRMGTNGSCWPGVRRLAQDSGLDAATVPQSVKRLERAAMVKVERRGNGRSNVYRLTPQSAWKTQALEKPKRLENPHTGARKTHAQARANDLHNQTDQLNQTQEARRQKAPPDPRVRQFIDLFSKSFQTAQGRSYVVTGAKDGATVKRLLAAMDREGLDALAELQRAAGNMLADDWACDKASIGLLSAQINKWRGKPTTTSQRRKPASFTPAISTVDYDSLAIPAENP